MTGEWALMGVFFAVILIQYYLIISERKHHSGKEERLLNRVMARNYETYAQVELAGKEMEKLKGGENKLTPEEYLRIYGEEGIPVI